MQPDFNTFFFTHFYPVVSKAMAQSLLFPESGTNVIVTI